MNIGSIDKRFCIAGMGTIPATRLHSARRHRWFVEPIDGPDTQTHSNDKNAGTILCGYLFNADVQRAALGLGVGTGEQCCIALEPIADARLPICDRLCVNSKNSELTGVQLLCGHRFSAVYLLWHWTMSPMLCPMCRAPYCVSSVACNATSNTIPTNVEAAARWCKIENFPSRYWRKLRELVRIHIQDQAEEETRQLRMIQREIMMEDVLHAVIGPGQSFVLMATMRNESGENMFNYVPLFRTNVNHEALHDDMVRFNVQRASLRGLTAMIRNAIGTDSVHEPHVLRFSVLMRLDDDDDSNENLLMRVSRVSEIEIPTFRIQEVEPIEDVVTVIVDIEVSDVVERAITADTLYSGPVAADLVRASMRNHDTLATVSSGIVSSDGLLDHLAEQDSPGQNSPGDNHVVMNRGSTPSAGTPNESHMYRYTNVAAPCVDLTGILQMEFCENTQTGCIHSLLSATLALRACEMLNVVAQGLHALEQI